MSNVIRLPRGPGKTPGLSVLQRLYDSQINFEVSAFWDTGFELKLGDPIGGYKARTNVKTWTEAERWFAYMARRHYPASVFAREPE
jgi:hypothetical protein